MDRDDHRYDRWGQANWLRGHTLRKAIRWLAEDRGYVTPCWIWQVTRNPKGYGFDQVHGVRRTAHRSYYEAFMGPIPEGLELDHLCRQRACVNPAHLRPVTSAQNKWSGERAKLTVEDVRTIRASTDRVRDIADRFGIDLSHAYAIRRRDMWADVE